MSDLKLVPEPSGIPEDECDKVRDILSRASCALLIYVLPGDVTDYVQVGHGGDPRLLSFEFRKWENDLLRAIDQVEKGEL